VSLADGGDLPRRLGPLAEQDLEPGLVEHRHLEARRLLALEPGDSPTTTKCVFLDTEPLTLPPSVVTASVAWSRENRSSEPVTTTVMPSSGRGPEATRSSSIRTPAVPPAAHPLAVPVDGEPLGDGARDGRPDAVDRDQLLRRGRRDRLDRAERVGQGLRRGRADVPDGQSDQDSPQWTLLGLLQVDQQVPALVPSEPSLLTKNGTA
jgi:hypothetical protein